MKPIDNWKSVLTRAWSVRLMVFAALLSGVEATLAALDPSVLGLPSGVFSALAGVISAAAVLVRIVAQPEMHNGK